MLGDYQPRDLRSIGLGAFLLFMLGGLRLQSDTRGGPPCSIASLQALARARIRRRVEMGDGIPEDLAVKRA